MGGKTPSTHAASLLASLSEQAFRESDKPRREYFRQLNEALRTGGVGARIPIIQRAVEGQQVANTAGLESTRNMLARAGLQGTPYSTAALANQTVSGTRQVADIGPSIAREMIAGAPPALTSATGIPGLAAAASLQQNAQLAGASATGQAAGTGGQALGNILAAYLSSGGRFGLGGETTPTTTTAPAG